MAGVLSNFMDLDDEFSAYENSGVVIVPIPYEKTVSFGKGTAKGPAAIIKASSSIELYDDELHCEPADIGIHTVSKLESDLDTKEMTGLIRSENLKHLDKGKFIINIGGEHTVTLGAVLAHKQFSDFSVLSIDAHCDLRDTYEDKEICHATVMRRVVEENIPLVEVGIRSYSKEESQYIINSENVSVIHATEIQNNTDWITQAISGLKDKVYLSIDVDGLDPSIIPSTGTPEPGGLGWYETLELLRKLFLERDVIGMDIVELAPVQGIYGPDVLAAKLAYKSIGYKFFQK